MQPRKKRQTMNWRVEGEPKSMDVYADFVFAFKSHTVSEKLSPPVEFEGTEEILSLQAKGGFSKQKQHQHILLQ